jgi:hypothetical protein
MIRFADDCGSIYASTAQAVEGLWATMTATIKTAGLPAGNIEPTALIIGVNGASITVPQTAGPYIIGFRMCLTGALSEQEICRFENGSSGVQTSFWIEANGTIKAYRAGSTLIGTSSNAVTIAENVWNYVELQLSANSSTGILGIRINGASVLQTTADTQGQSSAIIGAIGLGCNIQAWFQDIVVTDSTGTYNTTYLGDVSVIPYYPISNGTHTDYIPNGAASLYQCVNAVTPADSTVFASDSTVGDKMSNNLAPTSVTGTISGVVLVGRAQKTSAGTRTANLFALNGGTEVDGANIALGTSYAYSTQVLEVDPATSAPFVNSGFNTLQIGVATAS